MDDLIQWTLFGFVLASTVADFATRNERRWPLYASTAAWFAWLAYDTAHHNNVQRGIDVFFMLANAWLINRRPPGRRPRAARLLGYKARAALARLRVATTEVAIELAETPGWRGWAR